MPVEGFSLPLLLSPLPPQKEKSSRSGCRIFISEFKSDWKPHSKRKDRPQWSRRKARRTINWLSHSGLIGEKMDPFLSQLKISDYKLGTLQATLADYLALKWNLVAGTALTSLLMNWLTGFWWQSPWWTLIINREPCMLYWLTSCDTSET